MIFLFDRLRFIIFYSYHNIFLINNAAPLPSESFDALYSATMLYSCYNACSMLCIRSYCTHVVMFMMWWYIIKTFFKKFFIKKIYKTFTHIVVVIAIVYTVFVRMFEAYSGTKLWILVKNSHFLAKRRYFPPDTPKGGNTPPPDPLFSPFFPKCHIWEFVKKWENHAFSHVIFQYIRTLKKGQKRPFFPVNKGKMTLKKTCVLPWNRGPFSAWKKPIFGQK